MATKTMTSAKRNKADEFYTQLNDIEQELKHYKEHFYGKIVFCNCDDPYESNFFKYFAMNFNFLGLKKLIATCYDTSPIAYTQLSFFGENKTIPNGNRKAYKIEIEQVADYNGDGAVDLSDVEWLLKNKNNTLTMLNGDGDFRSDECIELLAQADVVVTNPPFSLFREYVAQLIEYEKQFIIIGNKNAITYKEIFSLIKAEKVWLGYRNINADMWFVVPDNYECEKVIDGKRLKHIMGCWFTNIDTTKRHENLTLYRTYNADEYPKYDNYDAINIDKVSDMPYDYDGYMGVPITFLDKYNPEQFEIIKFRKGNDDKDLSINGKCPYFRIIIRRRKNEN
ncbi:MAG: adenine-specific methyltransferase EcoRI family protein [Clostridiales bacterium]|nr:adenine-specific methyltransferase EcoRI family protein [Clostridiales bacterium]